MNDIKSGMRRFHGADFLPFDLINPGKPALGPNDELIQRWKQTISATTELQFTISNHFHPYAGKLTGELLRGSVAGLQAVDTQLKPGVALDARPPAPGDYALHEDFFAARYQPGAVVNQQLPVRNLDFDVDGAYAVYNWELFYHIPMAVALQLTRNQRFAEAQTWLHYLFDPTDASDGPPERHWKVQPFQVNEVQQIENILVALAGDDPATADLRAKTILAIEAWRRAPLRPHLVARTRSGAYKLRTLMAYLDNLIAWGDSLFRQDSPETIDEAAMHYIRAAQLLGKRPAPTPRRGTPRTESYRTLRKDLDEFGNALRKLEAELAFDFAPMPASAPDNRGMAAIDSIGRSLYFCVPANEKLLGYWDTVGDRLFKIRNSLNFQGVYRQLPLFDPPIDPGLLARGVAAGLDPNRLLDDIDRSQSPVRFTWWMRHAQELCQEVRALGSALLAAMEKEDAEALAMLRARHESALLTAIESVRYGQLAEAGKNREGVEKSIVSAAERYRHFEQMLGRKPDEIRLPELEALHAEGLDQFKFKNTEPELSPRGVEYDIVEGMAGLTGGRVVNRHEVAEILLSRASSESMAAASHADGAAALFSAMPDFAINCMFWGVGPTVELGPRQIAAAVQSLAASMRANATTLGTQSQDAARLNGFARREQEWAQQSNAAAGEISLLYKQLRAAQIREAVAAREWSNHKKQIAHAREIEQFLGDEREGKVTRQALYTWMKRETHGLYTRALDQAQAAARMAERAMQHELGRADSFIGSAYASGNEAMLAGERLALDLQRLSVAYHEWNVRELELQENVSLLQLNPQGLMHLRTSGSCTLDIPEAFFDRRTPGHYRRKLRTVAVSIPCVTGPHMLVHCTLALTASKIRTSAALKDGKYPDAGPFQELRPAGTARIVTSGAQHDDGLFDGAGSDERYLPFEGQGAISTWQIDLPSKMRDFDYATISDVILHLGYTALDGVDKAAVLLAVEESLKRQEARGRTRLFSLREDFPDTWETLRSASPGDTYHAIEVALSPEHYPYWLQSVLNGRALAVQQIDFYAVASEEVAPLRSGSDAAPVEFPFSRRWNEWLLYECALSPVESKTILSDAFGTLRCQVQPGVLQDFCFAISWQAP
ncbi:insecticidal toxin protein [Pseudoduganella namucuonensis]|uniref:Tc toxin complex TcA C-terminal TcB-binding domain-containing protein n=1 Tax=Pseudoduganella namucuonensis TaxID=1035707 RepID=A0A1I7LXZ8_9BURK|nr:insecticidal toxin protein [Pseudoduganella namucuonensis]SFV14450.1 hypothetical protein SAMN05216552_104226 [Pseudoduganella namucuonensis]